MPHSTSIVITSIRFKHKFKKVFNQAKLLLPPKNNAVPIPAKSRTKDVAKKLLDTSILYQGKIENS